MREQWRPIAGYEGLYEISDQGRVKSLRFGRERILNPRSGNGAAGHLAVTLPGRKNHYVHRMVAEAFLGPCPVEGHIVCHKNGNAGDNRAENLYWGSRKENVLDTWKHRSEQEYADLHARIKELEHQLGRCMCQRR